MIWFDWFDLILSYEGCPHHASLPLLGSLLNKEDYPPYTSKYLLCGPPDVVTESSGTDLVFFGRLKRADGVTVVPVKEVVQERELAFFIFLHSKLDVGFYTVQVLVEGGNQVQGQGCTSVVHKPPPEKGKCMEGAQGYTILNGVVEEVTQRLGHSTVSKLSKPNFFSAPPFYIAIYVNTHNGLITAKAAIMLLKTLYFDDLVSIQWNYHDSIKPLRPLPHYTGESPIQALSFSTSRSTSGQCSGTSCQNSLEKVSGVWVSVRKWLVRRSLIAVNRTSCPHDYGSLLLTWTGWCDYCHFFSSHTDYSA